ncbi:MAG: hypothetical protein ACKOC1_09560 [Hyphomicrobiales bacterium]
MNKVVKLFPGDYNGRGNGGSGPEDPMLEQRVARLEADVSEIKSSAKSIEVTLAEIKGKLSQLPTWLQLVAVVISTWMAGAGIVLALIKFSK